MDKCEVNGKKVKAQDGDFYGGWITHNIEIPEFTKYHIILRYDSMELDA
jgi:hypothetical protein